MRIEDLRYFIRVAEAGSISQVAQSHYITQQGLSRIISSLEAELDVKLLYRGKNLQLTPAGRALLGEAKAIEESYLRLMEKASGLSTRWNNAKGNIYTIYATPVLCSTILPGIIATLNKKFPGMFFNVLERLPLVITDEVSRQENPNPRSIAILSLPDFLEEESETLSNKTLQFEQLFSDDLCIAVAADSPLAGLGEIAVEQLKDTPFVVHNTELLMVKRLLGDWFRDDRVTHTTNHVLCRDLVSQGMTVGLTSAIIQYANPDEIVGVPLANKINIKYGVVRWETEDPFVEEIVTVVREAFRKINRAIN